MKAHAVKASEDSLTVDLIDERNITVPIAWYPRLMHGTSKQRNNWRLIGAGAGMHWPDLEEDVSVNNLLAGKPSGESQRSFKQWLERKPITWE